MSEIPAVIVKDIRRDAEIGRGDRLVTPDWVLGIDRARPPTLRVEGVGQCRELDIGQRCSFTLVREMHASAPEMERDLPTHLSCKIELIVLRADGGDAWWHVIPGFPSGSIASRCKVATGRR